MHEKANAKTPRGSAQSTNTTPAEPITCTSQTQPPTARASTPANATQSTNAPTKPKLDKTLFDLVTDVTAELIVEAAKLDRLGRYLTKNPKD